MADDQLFELDRARLVEHAREAAAARARHPGRYRLRRWLKAFLSAGVMILIIVPLMVGTASRAYDPGRPSLWFGLALTLLIAALNMLLNDRAAKRSVTDPQRQADEMQADADRFTKPGWVRRTLNIGVILGLVVGVPIGLLLALLPLEDTYAGNGERLRAFLAFLGLTFAWTIPVAFGIRWLTLRSLKPYRRAAPAGSGRAAP